MNNKKMLPLLAVTGLALLLALVLVLVSGGQAEEPAGISLCSLRADEIDQLNYQGNNTDVTLLKGSEGSWMLDSDPTLPLDQNAVQALVEEFAGLTAQRSLSEEDMAAIPARSETPLMVFAISGAGETCTLTVDQVNEVADVYYVYDEQGHAYTVDRLDLSGLCKAPEDLYAAQTLTEQAAENVTVLQVEDLRFLKTDDLWVLADDAAYPLDQSAVNKMVNTICGLQTQWSITTPEADAVYGLDSPDVTAELTFADGSTLTVRFGSLVGEDDTRCYLASSGAPTVVYEVDADHRNAFAVTKESLYDAQATAEAAEEGDVIAQYPVGGRDDYADAIE